MVRTILQDQDEFETLRRLDNTDESIQSHMINNTIVANNSEFYLDIIAYQHEFCVT